MRPLKKGKEGVCGSSLTLLQDYEIGRCWTRCKTITYSPIVSSSITSIAMTTYENGANGWVVNELIGKDTWLYNMIIQTIRCSKKALKISHAQKICPKNRPYMYKGGLLCC